MHDSAAEVIPVAFHRRGMLFGTAISRSVGRSIRGPIGAGVVAIVRLVTGVGTG
jgi:hypothetical protein